ncbi:MAG: hypothetical protein P8Y93_10590 [Acidobacteriota bacterium]
MPSASLLIIDPLTLMGRELLQESERLAALATVDFRHTAEDEEHQIAEFAGQPALVPPLSPEDALGDYDVVVVTSDASQPRHEHLVAHLASNPGAALVDANRIAALRDLCSPSLGRTMSESRRLRPAHPALVSTSAVVEVLSPFGIIGGSLAVLDPVSSGGRPAVERLALQAGRRIQGAPVEDLIEEHVLAFNLVAVDSDDLAEDAAVLLPGFSLAISRSISGIFHGHLAHLGLAFETHVSVAEVVEALSAATSLELCELPLSLDSVPDHDRVLVAPPTISPDGRQLLLTLMADGLRIGGSLTTLDILETLI